MPLRHRPLLYRGQLFDCLGIGVEDLVELLLRLHEDVEIATQDDAEVLMALFNFQQGLTHLDYLLRTFLLLGAQMRIDDDVVVQNEDTGALCPI